MRVGVGVEVGVCVAVSVGVAVLVRVEVGVLVEVGVGVRVGVSASAGQNPPLRVWAPPACVPASGCPIVPFTTVDAPLEAPPPPSIVYRVRP